MFESTRGLKRFLLNSRVILHDIFSFTSFYLGAASVTLKDYHLKVRLLRLIIEGQTSDMFLLDTCIQSQCTNLPVVPVHCIETEGKVTGYCCNWTVFRPSCTL